jgi:UDP-N-acetylglucosamine 2-epimerase (non-hydrolysing)
MSNCSLIISDSGGIQEEAPSLNIPVLVTRETTEREEGLNSGCSILVGTNTALIVQEAKKILTVGKVGNMINPYGDGLASIRIADFIQNNVLVDE